MKGHHQHAERTAVKDLAIGPPGLKRVMIHSSGANYELTDAAGGVGGSCRVLRRKPLVIMVVAHEHDIGAGLVEVPPESVIGAIAAVRP